MKIKGGTRVRISMPVELEIPHDVDFDTLADSLAASFRFGVTTVKGGYYTYKLGIDSVTPEEMAETLAQALGYTASIIPNTTNSERGSPDNQGTK